MLVVQNMAIFGVKDWPLWRAGLVWAGHGFDLESILQAAQNKLFISGRRKKTTFLNIQGVFLTGAP